MKHAVIKRVTKNAVFEKAATEKTTMDKSVRKKHILMISQYFYPEQFRVNDLCTQWIKRGYEVTVITGIPNYPQGKFYPGYGLFRKRYEIWQGVKIVRLPLIPRGNSTLTLILNYLSFVISGFFWHRITKLKADYVFIYEVSPMTQALPGVWFGRRRRIPCYLYVTDLWPENVEYTAGINNRLILWSIGKMVNYIYGSCNRIFTSSMSFIKAIEARGVDLEKLEYWPQYAEGFYHPVSKEEIKITMIPRDGSFHVIFAGNIGYAQGLEILPRAAKLLKQKHHKVLFSIVGDGRFKDNLANLIKRYQVSEYFQFIPQQPPERIPELMAVCDAALICLGKNKVFSITLPAKTQSCLACGIPILVSGDGEIQEVIEEAKAGLCSDAGDYKGLAGNIETMLRMSEEERKAMAEHGLKYYKEHYDREALLERMDRWFSDMK